MSKIRSFFRSDRARKISAACLLVVVICSLFSVSVLAADTYELVGARFFNNSVGSGLMQPNVLVYVTSGTPTYPAVFESFGQRFIGFGIQTSSTGVYEFQGIEVYNKQFGWVDGNYRYVSFGTGSVVDESTYLFITSSSSVSLGSTFDDGYSSGYDAGYSAGVDAGYSSGYDDGRTATDSENLGANLLGDTLSAPMKALNQFTLYESSSGFTVTLGLVVGGAISLTLFIAFLKIFAGG